MTALSWTPTGGGYIFCSPACGRGCTKAEHAAAKMAGAALCKRLGPSWTPRVWENLGWYYEAVSACGRWKVSPVSPKHTHYIAFLGEVGCGGTWSQYGTTPEEAIAKTREHALAEVIQLAGLLDLKVQP